MESRLLEVSLTGLRSPGDADIFVEADGVSYFRKPELISQSGACQHMADCD